MQWYYLQNNERIGPIEDEQLKSLLHSGVINAETLVWSEGLADWMPYGNIQKKSAEEATHSTEDPDSAVCAVSGEMLSTDEMVKIGDVWVGAAHKELYLQQLSEGKEIPTVMNYAGFWWRVLAKMIDGIIAGIIHVLIMLPTIGLSAFTLEQNQSKSITAMILYYVLSFGFSIGYYVYFNGKWGATPGKMACSLKIIRSNGESISYSLALGRFFGDILSGILCYIGYIIAGFDEQKRALHDYICDTRVIKK